MLNQNLDKIEMKSYLTSLIEQIRLGFNKESIEVTSTINATLPLSHAVYVGLIVNELLTNAYKYAFDKQGGFIEILLHKENGQYYLRVKDNGKGFEPTQKRQGNLGLILVSSLVKEQLRGEMKFKSLGGVLFEVWSSTYSKPMDRFIMMSSSGSTDDYVIPSNVRCVRDYK